MICGHLCQKSLQFVSMSRPQQLLVNVFQHTDAAGATALHLAARFDHQEVVQWLLSVGGVADVETSCGAVPAHYAAANGNLTCLQLLLPEAPG